MTEEDFFKDVARAKEKSLNENKTYEEITKEFAKFVENKSCRIGG